jgi:hypothetical protein
MNIFRIHRKVFSRMFFFSIRRVSIIAIMALASNVMVVVIVRIKKSSTIIIKILREDIVIIVAYTVYTKSLAKKLTIGINIDQCFSLLHLQAVSAFAMHKRIHTSIPIAQRCQAC